MSSEADEKRAEMHARLDKVLLDFAKGVDSIKAGIDHPLNEVNLDHCGMMVRNLEELNAMIFKRADEVVTILMDLAMEKGS